MLSSAIDRRVAAVSSFISLVRVRSSFEYIFSKLAYTSMADIRCGSENFKPRQRTSFWKKDSLCDEMFLDVLVDIAMLVQRPHDLVQVCVAIILS